MAGAEGVEQVAVILAALVGVVDQQRDRRAGGQALEHARQDLHRIGLVALRDMPAGAGAAAIEVGLDVGFTQRHARRAAVDHAADGRAMALAEVGDAKEVAEGGAGHGSGRGFDAGPFDCDSGHAVVQGGVCRFGAGKVSARAGGSASARRSCCAPTALRCSALWPVAQLAALTGVRYAQTGCDKSVDVARCARGPQSLRSSAPRRRAATCPGAPLRMQRMVWRCEHQYRWTSRQAAPGRGDLWGGEEHRTGVGARSALRGLTRRTCPSAVSAANVASCAARPQAEHRSGVDAKRRPLHHEPLPGPACRDAPDQRVTRQPRRRYSALPSCVSSTGQSRM